MEFNSLKINLKLILVFSFPIAMGDYAASLIQDPCMSVAFKGFFATIL